MHIVLFLISTALLIAAGRACLRAVGTIRPELILISLTSLYLAYPVKNLALAIAKDDFITFDFYRAASPAIYLHFIVFAAIAWIVLARRAGLAPADAAYVPPRGVDDPALYWQWLIRLLLVINSLFLFWSVYQVTEGQLATLLFTSDARKAFLLNQQGQGWVSLLIFFAFPLIALQERRAVRSPVVIASMAVTFLSLATIGSRLFLFGYAICLIVHFYRMTPLIAATMFISFVLFGALIYMGFSGASSVNSTYYGIIYFMRTFDGADLLNGYLETGQTLYYGVTLVQETLVTYVPRLIWHSKPFNFGGIVITGDIYPELQDVQSLRATFPPGMFLEGYANFWLLCPIFYYAVMKFLTLLSLRRAHANVYAYALYVAGAAMAATIFRGFGSFIVSLTAFSMVLLLVFVLSLPLRRIATPRQPEGHPA